MTWRRFTQAEVLRAPAGKTSEYEQKPVAAGRAKPVLPCYQARSAQRAGRGRGRG